MCSYFRIVIIYILSPESMIEIVSAGSLVYKLKDDYIKYNLNTGCMSEAEANEAACSGFTSNDANSPLYFWQIHSAIGEDCMRRLITEFYTRVLNDYDDPQFKNAFSELGDIEYHVRGQLRFWKDALGGKASYRPGEKGLRIHHEFAREVMTERGANRWMMHMTQAISSLEKELKNSDERAVQCIHDFLSFFMKKYGAQFDFNWTYIRSKL